MVIRPGLGAALVLAAVVVVVGLSACAPAGPNPAPSDGPSTSPALSGDPLLSGLPRLADVVESTVADAEAALAQADIAALDVNADLAGDEAAGAVRDVQAEVHAALLDEALSSQPGASPSASTGRADPLSGHLAAAGPGAPAAPLTALSGRDFSGNVVLLTVYVGEMMRPPNPANDGTSGGTPSTDTATVTIGDLTIQVTVTSSLSLVSSGSTLTGAADVQTTITVLSADGRPLETVTQTSHGIVEIDRCPDPGGLVSGNYELELRTAGGGASAVSHLSGRVVGTVEDDAWLHGFVIDASGSRAATTARASTDMAASVHAEYDMSGAPGSISRAVLRNEQATIVRDEPSASTADYVELLAAAISPGQFIAMRLFERAQVQWRTGACVEIQATEQDRFVEPDEQVRYFADVVHKVSGDKLEVPVVASLVGPSGLDPADTPIRAPATFTYEAGSNNGDLGEVRMTTTSRRGIGKLTLRFLVRPPLELELLIQSEIEISKYNTFSADSTADVGGAIRLTFDEEREAWSGRGTLDSLTTSSGSGGCQTIEILGFGSYDWFVSRAMVSPYIDVEDFEIHMDAGPIPEQPDSFTANACPAGVLTGDVNTWENLFFTIHRSFYGAEGFRLDDLSPVTATTPWVHKQVLGELAWIGSCEDDPILAQVASCEIRTEFTLTVIDPTQP